MDLTDDIKYKFSSALFWDIDREDLDMEKHKTFIVGRVLDYGTWDDWKIIRDYYSIEQLKEIAMNIRSLFPQSLSFIAAVTQTPIEKFRCYKQKQLIPSHWNF